MKKLLAILISVILCASLVACSGSNAGNSGNPSGGAEPAEEDSSLMAIETKYGDLSYPAKWEDSLATTESEKNNIFFVNFSAKIGEQEYNVFTVMICGEEGDSVGTITDKSGTTRNVFVDIPELSELTGLSEEDQNLLYAMQEGVNVLIENLH